MMRGEDRRQREAARASRYASTGAASPGSTTAARVPFAQQPDVVVRECGDGDNRRHGRIFRTRRHACQRRSPTGSRRRSAAICSRASRRTSTRRSPTSSASTRCRSGCPSARSSRKAASPSRWTLDYEPPARHHRRSALAAVRRELARPHRAAARARVHRRSAPAAARGVPRRSAPRARSSSRASIRSRCSAPSAISAAAQTPPWNGNFIALYRLKDWLALLGFDVIGGAPRLLRAAVRAARNGCARFGFFETAGDRWWPIAGGVYYLRATKKVLGMRVITPAWERRERRRRRSRPRARARKA